MKSKLFIKIYSLVTLTFMVVTTISVTIIIVLDGIRNLKKAHVVHTSIPITESATEEAARFILGLWTSPWSVIFFGLSLIFSLLWLYTNIKSVKRQVTKLKDGLSESGEKFFSEHTD